MECRTNDTRTQSVLSTVNNQITYRVRDGRAGVHPSARRHLPFAGGGVRVLEDGDCGCAASSSAKTAARWSRIAPPSIVATTKTPVRSPVLLAKAPNSIRRLFGAE